LLELILPKAPIHFTVDLPNTHKHIYVYTVGTLVTATYHFSKSSSPLQNNSAEFSTPSRKSEEMERCCDRKVWQLLLATSSFFRTLLASKSYFHVFLAIDSLSGIDLAVNYRIVVNN
jgi:hypothetical protein